MAKTFALNHVGDTALLDQLRRDNFQGPLWERFRDEIGAYGIAVIRGWIISSAVFSRCSDKNIFCPSKSHSHITHEDAWDLASDVVSLAVDPYREYLRR